MGGLGIGICDDVERAAESAQMDFWSFYFNSVFINIFTTKFVDR